MSDSAKLEAARATGSLHKVIKVLREEARAETPKTGPPIREQVGIEDATIRMAAGPAANKRGAERRGIFRDLQSGVTVTSEGTKTVTTSPTPRLAEMTDDELQAVDYNNLGSADLDAYTAELDRRTPEHPASSEDEFEIDFAEAQAWQVEEGEDAESFDIDDEQEFNPVLPWEVGR